MNISIIMPVFNEDKTVVKTLGKVINSIPQQMLKEIVVVDDGSTDNSYSKVKEMRDNAKIKVLHHTKNKGKGAAIRTALKHAAGDYIIIQDADLEYNPKDIPRLIDAIDSKDDVIYGTRLKRLPHIHQEEESLLFFIHFFGNRFLSLVTSVLYGCWLTDIETCYKLIPRKKLLSLKLASNGFEFEAEVTSKLLKEGLHVREIPIVSKPRGFREGKKLKTIPDGIKAFWTILRYRFIDEL